MLVFKLIFLKYQIMLIRKINKIIFTNNKLNSSFSQRFFYSQFPKIDPNKDYYRILDVPRDASAYEVQVAYSKLMHIYDPTINPANKDKFFQIQEAKQILSNDRLRKQYDKERFYVKFTDQMNERFQKQNDEPYETKKRDEYSYDLTPEEEEVANKTKRFIKWSLMIATGLAIFLPFFLWKGGNEQPTPIEAAYPMRLSSQHRAELARQQYQEQQMREAYQQRYPSSPYNGYPPQGPQQNPNIIVTGEFVTD